MTRSTTTSAKPILSATAGALLFSVVWSLIKLIIYVRLGIHAYRPAKPGA